MVRGSKRVRLYSPAATRYLYPMPLYGESPNHSAVDVAAPDSRRHPLYKQARQHEVMADIRVRVCCQQCFLSIQLSREPCNDI